MTYLDPRVLQSTLASARWFQQASYRHALLQWDRDLHAEDFRPMPTRGACHLRRPARPRECALILPIVPLANVSHRQLAHIGDLVVAPIPAARLHSPLLILRVPQA